MHGRAKALTCCACALASTYRVRPHAPACQTNHHQNQDQRERGSDQLRCWRQQRQLAERKVDARARSRRIKCTPERQRRAHLSRCQRRDGQRAQFAVRLAAEVRDGVLQQRQRDLCATGRNAQRVGGERERVEPQVECSRSARFGPPQGSNQLDFASSKRERERGLHARAKRMNEQEAKHNADLWSWAWATPRAACRLPAASAAGGGRDPECSRLSRRRSPLHTVDNRQQTTESSTL